MFAQIFEKKIRHLVPVASKLLNRAPYMKIAREARFFGQYLSLYVVICRSLFKERGFEARLVVSETGDLVPCGALRLGQVWYDALRVKAYEQRCA